MPSYKLPKEEHSHENDMNTMGPEMYERMITVPANSKILDALSIGDKVEVTLMGEVTRLENVEAEEHEHISFQIKVTEVMAYPEDYEEEAQEGFSKGFKKGSPSNSHGSHNSHY